MKCGKCEKPATFHITELTGEGKPQELHLCEECAREYLATADGPEPSPEEDSLLHAGALASQFKVGQTADELARLDQQACPVCGVTFYEFRNHGRLGCPHDYTCFSEELEPLMLNIHGEVAHTGKRPKKHQQTSENGTEAIRLRREMKEAIEREDYEEASRLRDTIKQLENQ